MTATPSPDHAAAGEGTERPGVWVDGIGWVARLGDVADDDLIRHGEQTSDPARDVRRWYTPTVLVEVARWADGETPQPPVPPTPAPQADRADLIERLYDANGFDDIKYHEAEVRGLLTEAADALAAPSTPAEPEQADG